MSPLSELANKLQFTPSIRRFLRVFYVFFTIFTNWSITGFIFNPARSCVMTARMTYKKCSCLAPEVRLHPVCDILARGGAFWRGNFESRANRNPDLSIQSFCHLSRVTPTFPCMLPRSTCRGRHINFKLSVVYYFAVRRFLFKMGIWWCQIESGRGESRPVLIYIFVRT